MFEGNRNTHKHIYTHGRQWTGLRLSCDVDLAFAFVAAMPAALALGILVGSDASSISTWHLGWQRCQTDARKYKIPRMDPLEIAEMEISEGPSNGGLSLSMRNVKMYGLKHAVLQKTEFDFDRNHVMYDTNIPVLTILGEYEVSGRILLLPISGKGDINITLINSHLTYSYDFDIVERNGNRYHVTKNHKAVVEPTVGLYHLSNLFNGDKLLGKALNTVTTAMG
ncbi:hypothetical protein B7P43_G02430 [Cryptotermes secundus]|uniref:Protein takeout n=1 Tax=Cryptotermes secundus TaxID=105785 RepID=A0A2J7QFK0_9NEOP|nr:hypothetical protein B7P43_G02430 [Cryptotermes secundus]